MDWLPTAAWRVTGSLERSSPDSGPDSGAVIRGTVDSGMPTSGSACAQSWPAAKLTGTERRV
jgi:hypothetical protein